MEQNEVNRTQLYHPTGKETKKILEKKKISEPKYLRMIKAKPGAWFGTNEPFESEERDKEIAEKWLSKTCQTVRSFTS